jgi:hypothetical protein
MITSATKTKTFKSLDEAIDYIIGTEFTVNSFNYFVRELEEHHFVEMGDTIVYIDDKI